ncbi:hypothetical protein GCM10027347_59890 [Larkinella harenae]
MTLHERFGKDYLLLPYFADTAIYRAAAEKNDQNTDHPDPSGLPAQWTIKPGLG